LPSCRRTWLFPSTSKVLLVVLVGVFLPMTLRQPAPTSFAFAQIRPNSKKIKKKRTYGKRRNATVDGFFWVFCYIKALILQ